MVVYLTTLDKQWKTIAEHISGRKDSKLSKKLVGDDHVEELLRQHDVGVDLLETHFTTLLRYTGGEVEPVVNTLGDRAAFRALRWVRHVSTVLDGRQRIELGPQFMNMV